MTHPLNVNGRPALIWVGFWCSACASVESDPPGSGADVVVQDATLDAEHPPATAAPDEPPANPAPALSPSKRAETVEPLPRRFEVDPARALLAREGPAPGRGKGKLAGLELELIPAGNEVFLRLANTGKRRVWWCGPEFHLGNLYAVDAEGNAVAKAGPCPWTKHEEPRGDACGAPTQGTWSLDAGESSLLIRARARQTETGLLLELHDTNLEPRFEGVCIVIDADRVVLEGSWMEGTEQARDDWCRPKAKSKWDELSRHRQEGPWSAPLDMQWVFPPDREAIDDMPDRGHLTSNHVEVIARRRLMPTPPPP